MHDDITHGRCACSAWRQQYLVSSSSGHQWEHSAHDSLTHIVPAVSSNATVFEQCGELQAPDMTLDVGACQFALCSRDDAVQHTVLCTVEGQPTVVRKVATAKISLASVTLDSFQSCLESQDVFIAKPLPGQPVALDSD
eukprot:3628148-Amphidinium_carterae.1